MNCAFNKPHCFVLQLPSHPLTPSRHAEGRGMTVAPTYHTLPHPSSHGTSHSTMMWGPLEPPNTPKPWSLSCLRPAPPLRPSAALCYKEVSNWVCLMCCMLGFFKFLICSSLILQDLSKSPKSVKKLLPKRKPERKQSEEEFALRKSKSFLLMSTVCVELKGSCLAFGGKKHRASVLCSFQT